MRKEKAVSYMQLRFNWAACLYRATILRRGSYSVQIPFIKEREKKATAPTSIPT